MKQVSNRKTQSELLAEERDRARLEIDGLQAELDALLGKVADVSDEDVDKLSQSIASAKLRRDRAAARVEAVEVQLAEAQTREAETEHAARRREADAAAERAATEVEKLHIEISRLTRKMLEVAATADQKVDAVNASSKDESERVWNVDARIAQKFSRPRTVLSENTVNLWTYAQSGERVPDDKQLMVRANAEKPGMGILPGEGLTSNKEVILRTFRVIKFLSAERGWAVPLARKLNIPALVDGGIPGWSPIDYAPPESVLAKLQELADLEAQPDRRKPQIEIVEIDETSEVNNVAA